MTDFDIRNILTGRELPEGTVSVWFSDRLFFEREALEAALANATDKDELAAVEEQLEQNKKQLDKERFTVFIRGITPRASEDIISKALSMKPIKRDVYSREDDLQLIERNRLITRLSFAAHIVKIVGPDGSEQILDEDNRDGVVEAILSEAPPTAIETIDKGIASVSRNFADKLAKWQNTDFS